MKKYHYLITLFLTTAKILSGQDLALKNDLLYNATATINAGIEIGIAPRWSAEISAGYNPWTFRNAKKWKHWMIRPEIRYWPGNRFGGHFIGLHFLGGVYNISGVTFPFGLYPGARDNRYEGEAMGAGFVYGYQWKLSGRWNFEAALGIGYVRTRYDRYARYHCSGRLEKGYKNYYGPTKAAIAIIYRIPLRSGRTAPSKP